MTYTMHKCHEMISFSALHFGEWNTLYYRYIYVVPSCYQGCAARVIGEHFQGTIGILSEAFIRLWWIGSESFPVQLNRVLHSIQTNPITDFEATVYTQFVKIHSIILGKYSSDANETNKIRRRTANFRPYCHSPGCVFGGVSRIRDQSIYAA